MPDFISPPQYVQVNGTVCKVKTATLNTAVANNQMVIAAVASQVHRILGWKIFAQGGGATGYNFKGGTSGTVYYNGIRAATLEDYAQIFIGGYFELGINENLLTDVNTTGNATNVFYITYTP